MSNSPYKRHSEERTTSRTSNLPSIGPFAEAASVGRMFSEYEYDTKSEPGQGHQGTSSNVVVADEGPSPFNCTICCATLHSRTALKTHIMQKHEGKNVVKCPHCDKAFTRPSQMRKHIEVCHDNRTGEFYCEKCTFKNRDIEVFNQHSHLHNICPYCRNEFAQLSRHQPKCPYRP